MYWAAELEFVKNVLPLNKCNVNIKTAYFIESNFINPSFIHIFRIYFILSSFQIPHYGIFYMQTLRNKILSDIRNKLLKLVNQFTYLGNSISSTEGNVSIHKEDMDW